VRGEAQVYPGSIPCLTEKILFGQIAPAAPHLHAVGHGQFAVVAQIDAPPRAAPQRHEDAALHAGGVQNGIVAVQRPQAAHGIDQQAHAHAAARALGQRGRHGGTYFVVPEDEGAQVQRLPRAAQQGQQRGERIRAVRLKGHGRVGLRAGDPHGGEQLRGPGWRPLRKTFRCGNRGACGRACHLAGAEDQKQQCPQVRKDRDRHHPGQRRGGLAPLALRTRHDHIHQQAGNDGSDMFQRRDGRQGEHGAV
jgi:hypothetical protein